MDKLKKISETEYAFMEITWRTEKDLCMQDYLKIFKEEYGKDWEVSTVSTFLYRLVKKGYLTLYKVGRVYFYRPTMSKLDYKQRKINEAMEGMFGTSLAGVIATYCGKDQNNTDDVTNAEQLLDQFFNN